MAASGDICSLADALRLTMSYHSRRFFRDTFEVVLDLRRIMTPDDLARLALNLFVLVRLSGRWYLRKRVLGPPYLLRYEAECLSYYAASGGLAQLISP